MTRKPRFRVGQVVMELTYNPRASDVHSPDWRIDSGYYRVIKEINLERGDKPEYDIGTPNWIPEVWLRPLNARERGERRNGRSSHDRQPTSRERARHSRQSATP